MVSDYTPTTDEIRTRGLEGADLNDLNSDEREALDEFDQWLAKHDAEVERAAAEKAMPIVREWLLEAKAEALEDHAAAHYEACLVKPGLEAADQPSPLAKQYKIAADGLRARAAEYRREEA